MGEILTYDDGHEIEFKIDYESEVVKFVNGTINGKYSMYLREFSISVLGIEPETKEFVALFIGREVSDAFNKAHKYYVIKPIKSKKNFFNGTIRKIQKNKVI